MQRGGGSKPLILSDEQVHAKAGGLPMLREAIVGAKSLFGVAGARVVDFGWM